MMNIYTVLAPEDAPRVSFVRPSGLGSQQPSLGELIKAMRSNAFPGKMALERAGASLEFTTDRVPEDGDHIMSGAVPGGVVVREMVYDYFISQGVAGGQFASSAAHMPGWGIWFPSWIEGVLDVSKSTLRGPFRDSVVVPKFLHSEVALEYSFFRCVEDAGYKVFGTEKLRKLAGDAPFESIKFGPAVFP